MGMKTIRISVPKFLEVNCCMSILLLELAPPKSSSFAVNMDVRMPSPAAVLATDNIRLLTSECFDICTRYFVFLEPDQDDA